MAGRGIADVPEGGSVTVLGLGPIGDMACRIAAQRGLQIFGVETIDLDAAGGKVADIIRDATQGRGTDAVIDAVGMEAHGSPVAATAQWSATLLPDAVAEKLMNTVGVDRLAALQLAIDIVRRGGTISLVGVYGGMVDPLPMRVLFDKQIQLRMGQANVKRWAEDILPLLGDDDPLGVETFATQRLPLASAPDAYEMFQRETDGAVEVVLDPTA